MTISGFDYVVIGTIVFLIAFIQWRFYLASRSLPWRIVWGLFGVAFLIAEFIGALSGNTLSESFIRAIPLKWMEIGTVVAAIILMIHWWVLEHRIIRKIKLWVQKTF